MLEFNILRALADRSATLTTHLTRVCLGSQSRNNEKLIQRATKRLKKLAMIRAKIVSIIRGGSACRAHLWKLTKLGLKVAIEDKDTLRHRLRYWSDDYGDAVIRHTLATCEIEAQLIDLANSDIGFELKHIEYEPKCWRNYTIYGGTATIKPDMFAVTKYKGKMKYWFFETDRLTVRPVRILEKCQNYIDYLEKTFKNDWKDGLPDVVWVAVDDKHKDKAKEQWRKDSLTTAIHDKFGDYARVFKVITSAEIVETALGGAK
jgi:hypothetical protein